ncbi:MAG: CopD family protein [Kofleriaceae bacterium]
MYTWLLTGHLIGVLLWVGSLFTVYWLLRFHTQAPPSASDKLVLMERSMALVMDLSATLAMGCGIALIFPMEGSWHPDKAIFGIPKTGWFHVKLTLIVLGILSVHGILRGRVAKFSRGQTPTVPSWIWSLLLVAIVGIVVMVTRRPF